MKNLRQSLISGQSVVGTWCNTVSPIVAELLAACGLDYVCVDAEHSAVDVPQAQILFQAIASGNPDCAAVVRVHGVDYSFIKRYVDAGARGIICPLINSREDAELLVSAVKYPPQGNRGVGFCRANQYGLRVQEHYKDANSEILVAVQIEHIDAVEKIDEILSVEGVDAVFIGPYDLTASMGIAGQFDHPDYMHAQKRILSACKKHEIVPGIHVVQPDKCELERRVDEGYRFLAYSLDITMLLNSAKEGVDTFRNALKSAK